MNPIRFALRHPVTILVAMIALISTGALALWRMKVDIFPSLNLPVIYVAQPYGGMSPEQMEGLLTYYYEYHFLYIGNIHHVESRNIQSTSLMKLYFHPGTDMAQAMAETITQVNRARAFMPEGTVPPFVMRYDTGSVPVGYLVFSSEKPGRTLGQIQDQALNRVRPMFASLPGVSAPPPFGAAARAITVDVKPNKLNGAGVTAGDVVKAVDANNAIVPAGSMRIGGQMPLVPFNAMVTNPQELRKILVKPGVYLGDVADVADATDIATSYALVNGREAIYIPVAKRAEASTLTVVKAVNDNLDKMRDAVDPDIKVTFEFDQSPTVTRSITALEHEALLGALLTGLMVLLFLRDWRSVIVVVLNIPLALIGAVVALWLCDHTVNLMTLGGLALAVGILVDEATVEVENIHSQMEHGHPVARAVRLGNAETAVPRLLAMLCILAVFIPSFFMQGALRALFVPLSLAVGFSMITSYLLSSTLVPVLSVWLLRGRQQAPSASAGITPAPALALGAGRESRYQRLVRALTAARWVFVPVYFAVAAAAVWLGWWLLGREIFPTVDAGQVQLRLRAPPGSRVERTKELTVQMLKEIEDMIGGDKVQMSLGLVGLVPTSYPVNNVYQWMSGPEDSVMRLALKPGSGIRVEELRARLRRELPDRLRNWLRQQYQSEKVAPAEIEERLSGLSVTFEPGDIVNEIMSFGAPTPVEVAVSGQKFADTRAYAARMRDRLAKIDTLTDLQYGQALEYPTIEVIFDRSRVGPSGITGDDIGKTLTPTTSSSRFIVRNYWRAPDSGIGYQVQVQVPIKDMSSIEELKRTLIRPRERGTLLVVNGQGGDGRESADAMHAAVHLQDIADVRKGKTVGEYDRYNMRRMLTLTGNVQGEDLGRLEGRVRAVLAAMEKEDPPPRGVQVDVRGQLNTMQQLFAGLGTGLGLAVFVILLLLWAYFQSLRLALVVLATVPAVIAGVALALLATGTTLNLQSFMGAIMAIGVAVANAILLATFAERERRAGLPAVEAAVRGARLRLRPILMTSCAMIAGMLPLALGLGEGSEQTSPLGRAVVGGLLAATATTLFVLPGVFALVMSRAPVRSASLDPDDPESPQYDGAATLSP
jgi:multidrug efflux pump subunit AcrB